MSDFGVVRIWARKKTRICTFPPLLIEKVGLLSHPLMKFQLDIMIGQQLIALAQTPENLHTVYFVSSTMMMRQ
jgi:hypothetical protein